MEMLRGEIRKTWMMSPIKLAYYELGKEVDPDPNTRTKWRMKCECCNKFHNMKEIEIDHRFGNVPLTKIGHFLNYYDKILNVKFEDLQRLCKECHGYKTYGERWKWNFEDSIIMKAVIEAEKREKPANHDKFAEFSIYVLLLKAGHSRQDCSNAKKRRVLLFNHLKAEQKLFTTDMYAPHMIEHMEAFSEPKEDGYNVGRDNATL